VPSLKAPHQAKGSSKDYCCLTLLYCSGRPGAGGCAPFRPHFSIPHYTAGAPLLCEAKGGINQTHNFTVRVLQAGSHGSCSTPQFGRFDQPRLTGLRCMRSLSTRLRSVKILNLVAFLPEVGWFGFRHCRFIRRLIISVYYFVVPSVRCASDISLAAHLPFSSALPCTLRTKTCAKCFSASERASLPGTASHNIT
jgi:hypothetical protein